MASDPALIGAFRKQLRTVLASENGDAFLGLWMAWKEQAGVSRDDLIDAIKTEGAEVPL